MRSSATILGFVLSLFLLSTASAQPQPPSSLSNEFSGIDYFIVIYQENWSFDSLYGFFPGANGISNASAVAWTQRDRRTGESLEARANYNPVSLFIPRQNPPAPLNEFGAHDPRFLAQPANTNGPLLPGLNPLQPFDLARYLSATNRTGDLVHRFWQQQFQIHRGAMDRFVTWSDNPGLVMSYFDASQLPEGRLAQQFVLCDNFFHSAFGGSFLNHHFLVAAAAPVYPNGERLDPGDVAWLDGQGVLRLTTGNGYILRDGALTPIGAVSFANPARRFDKNYAVNTINSANLAPSGSPTSPLLLPSQNNSNPSDPRRPYLPTIGDRLDAAGISWKWYAGGWEEALDRSPTNPEHYGESRTNLAVTFQWHHQPFAYYDNYAPWINGQRNVRSAAHLQDERNFFRDLENGTLPRVSFVKPLGPDNEHPGYSSLLQGQQHVADLVAAVQKNPSVWAKAAIVITYDENGGRWDHVAPPTRDIWGPGTRVPTIIISPFARTNYVDHTQYETLSILSTLEKRFGLQPLNELDATGPTLAPAFRSR